VADESAMYVEVVTETGSMHEHTAGIQWVIR
jgi:hypothetical protein